MGHKVRAVLKANLTICLFASYLFNICLFKNETDWEASDAPRRYYSGGDYEECCEVMS